MDAAIPGMEGCTSTSSPPKPDRYRHHGVWRIVASRSLSFFRLPLAIPEREGRVIRVCATLASKVVIPEHGGAGVYNTILSGVLDLFVPPGRAVKRFWEKTMIARQFRGFTAAACLMLLAALGMPAASWAWESDGPRFNIYTQGYEKADVDEGGSYSKTETGVSAGYKWFTLSYKRSDFSWSDSDSVNFSKKDSPWDQLNKLTLDASFNGVLNESVSWFAGGSIISGFEDQIFSVHPLQRQGLRLLVHCDNGDHRIGPGNLPRRLKAICISGTFDDGVCSPALGQAADLLLHRSFAAQNSIVAQPLRHRIVQPLL